MLRVLIVDDEPLARENLRVLLQEQSDIEVVGECANAIEGSLRRDHEGRLPDEFDNGRQEDGRSRGDVPQVSRQSMSIVVGILILFVLQVHFLVFLFQISQSCVHHTA